MKINKLGELYEMELTSSMKKYQKSVPLSPQ